MVKEKDEISSAPNFIKKFHSYQTIKVPLKKIIKDTETHQKINDLVCFPVMILLLILISSFVFMCSINTIINNLFLN